MKWKKVSVTGEEMNKEGFYLVKSVLRHCYCQGWRLPSGKGVVWMRRIETPAQHFFCPMGV